MSGEKEGGQMTALEKMQEIAGRLISNTPELARILEPDSALRPKRPPSPGSKKMKVQTMLPGGRSEATANDYQDRCRELQNELQVAREKAQALEEEMGTIKQRFVEREIQYRKIIEELQEELKSKSMLDGSDRNRMQQITEMHKEILTNIGTIQNKTSKILIEQESDIRRYFHKKINEIKEKFKEDKINKTEKDQEYLQKEKHLLAELDWIKNIAHKIDLENQSLSKKYTALKADFDLQEKDKELLLKELLQAKKHNALLKSQVQQYETLLQEVSREVDEDPRPESFLPPISDSKLDSSHVSKRYDSTIIHLNKVLAKERKRLRTLKNLYMKELSSKSELEMVIRKLVDDSREAVLDLEKGRKRKGKEEISLEKREALLQQLLTNEKILTLIYDKTFYSAPKQAVQIPEDLEKILENDDEEGFS